MKHCCKEMDFFLEEGKVSIHYDKKIKFYCINLKRSQALQTIYFCPWCGSKLPKDLHKEYSTILFDEMGFDPLDDNYKKKIPHEFKTDEWWKKRGL